MGLSHCWSSDPTEIKRDSRTGTWRTVGDHGAEFVKLKKGDIVFNHKQTEALLERGWVFGRGSAYASGTAMANPNAVKVGVSGGWSSRNKLDKSNFTKTSTTSTSTNTSAQRANTGAVSNNTAATKANTEAKKDEETIASKLAGLYDWVAVKLEYFGHKTQVIADQINDYISSALKTNLLRRQINATNSEIDVNARAARVYRHQAEEVATKTGMSDSLVKKAKTGEWLFEDLSEETEEKVTTFLQYYDKAVEAEDKVRSLRNEQLKLYDDWANMPIEKAEKKIEAYTESLDKLGDAYSLISEGNSSLSAYLRMFNGRANSKLNTAQSVSKSKASGVTYAVLNPLLDAQLKEQLNTVKQYRTAYKQTESNVSKAQKEEKKAQKEAADLSKKRNKNSQWLLKQGYIKSNLSSSQLKSLRNNETVDTKGITNKKALDAIKEYNKKVQLARTANESATQATLNYNTAILKQKEAYSTMADAETDYAEMLVKNEKEKFDNIKNYYESLLSYREALAENITSNRSLKDALGKDMVNADYTGEINQLLAQRNILDREQLNLQKQLNASVSSGAIKKNSQEYYDLLNQILELNDSMRDIDKTIVNTQNDMRDTVPFVAYEKAVDETEQAVKRLNYTLNELTSTSSALKSGKSVFASYLDTIQKYSTKGMTAIQSLISGKRNQETFQALNAMLDKELTEQGKIVKEYSEQYEVAASTVTKAQAQMNSDKKASNTALADFQKQQKALQKNKTVLKSLTDSQKNALNKGTEISTSGITNKAALDAVHAYNSALALSLTKNEALAKSTEKYNDALNNRSDALKSLTDQELTYASAVVENEQKKFDNIRNFYDQLVDYRKTLADEVSNQRALKDAFRIDLTKTDFNREIAQLEEQRNNQIKERNALLMQFNNAVSSGKIKQGSEEYLAMDGAIREANSAIDSTTQSIISLQDNMRDTIITDKISDAIDKATKNVEKFRSALSSLTSLIDAVASGSSAFDQYAKILSVYQDTIELTEDQKLVRDKASEMAYIGQNMLLDMQSGAQRDTLNAMKTEVEQITDLVSQANKERVNAEKASDVAKSTLDKQITSLLKATATMNGLNDAQREAIKLGEAVETTGITNASVLDAITKYNALVTDAKTKNEDAVHATEVYEDALESQRQALEEMKDAESEYTRMLVDNERKKLDNISAYYESIASYRSTLADNLESARRVKEAYGTDTVEEDYRSQVAQLEAQREAVQKELELLQKSFDESVSKGIIKEGSQEFYEMKEQVDTLNSSVDRITTSILELQDDMRNEIFYRALQKALDTADHLRDALSSIRGLITDEMMFDDNGNITGLGITNLAMSLKEYESALGSLGTLLQKRNKILQSYNNGVNTTNYNRKEFEADMNEITGEIQSMLSNTNSLRQAITDMLAKTSKAELDATYKIIDARSELLRKQREYYDYDKTLKGKTNDLQALEAQLRALEGINDLETKAMRQRLEAQRASLQEDLDDTVSKHQYDLQIAGLDDLKVELQENYDNYVRDLNGNLEIIVGAVTDATTTISDSLDVVNTTVQALLSTFSGDLTGEIVGVPKYASGSRYVGKNGYGLTNENGGEIVVTNRGVFMPLPKGSGVIPSYLTSNLFGLAENYSQIMKGSGSGGQMIAPVVTSNVTINGTNMSEQDIVRTMNAHAREMSRQIQNDIRKDLSKSR